jgi:hypothetical protein
MAFQPTNEQLQKAVGAICKVIAQIPCFHVYEEYIARRFGTDEAKRALMAMMHNAALDSALLNLRCFNEFFKPNGRQDDIRAYHFPGLSMQPFLSPDDENAIHKHLAHLTTTRSDTAAKPWMLDQMTILGLQHGIQFLSFIETGFRMHPEAAYAELRGVREAANHLIQKVVKRHASQHA